MNPSVEYFFENIHLQLISLEPCDKSTKSQVPLDNNESISSFTISFQNVESLDFIISLNVLEPSSMLNKIGVLFSRESQLLSTRKTIACEGIKSKDRLFSFLCL